ncbi:hypothetical protein N1851_003846 [Merluccius polli]|uniref:HAT C-terminal dimerisation domain-containing protein n=1 Tax=Merluccius polli TaxID=89951 RepID=A0AA47N9B8_MERPO|nr:hypothetical protein N1851_003846 [Merluccius polli]
MRLNTASYLDPRFLRLIHLERDQQQKVREKIKGELTVIAEEEVDKEDEEVAAMATGTAPGENHNQCYGEPFWECADTLGGTSAIGAVLQQEMLTYESETPLPTGSNPLSWWKMSKSKYPHLAQLARR